MLMLCESYLFADEHVNSTGRKLFKDGKLIPYPYTVATSRPNQGTFTPDGGKERFDEATKKFAEETDGIPGYVMTPAPIPEDDIENFELSIEERIPGCSYAAGYTFPDFCHNSENEVIFEAGRDSQSVLDQLKKEHGIKSNYNIVPKGYKARPDDANQEGEFFAFPTPAPGKTVAETVQEIVDKSKGIVDTEDGL